MGCDNNQIVNLNLSNLNFINFLVCNNNNINTLNLSNLVSLTSIFCEYNSLTDLDVSVMTNFASLHCNNNPLISLNLKTGYLFNYQNLNSFNMNYSNCPNLSTICVDDFNIASIHTKTINYGYLNCSVNSNCNLDSENFDSFNEIRVFPNPLKNILNIESSEIIEDYVVNIYDVFGQVVKVLNGNPNLKNIDVSELKSGCYFIKMTHNEKVKYSKFIKE